MVANVASDQWCGWDLDGGIKASLNFSTALDRCSYTQALRVGGIDGWRWRIGYCAEGMQERIAWA
jgi:hypothetical protein